MALLDGFKKFFNIGTPGTPEGVTAPNSNEIELIINEGKKVEFGSSGTRIFAGYLDEEYLAELQGTDWADKIDQMRRSDAIISMCLKAFKLPLLSANWYIKIKEGAEEDPIAKMQEEFFEKVYFEDLGSFTKTLGEILTCYDFGYSLMEVVHKITSDKEFNQMITLKKLAWRSQRTIQTWNICPHEKELISVTQWADGDLGLTVDIPAQYLVHFCPNQEGDNFEGIAITRPMYGPYLRKNHFLRLLAAGLEKYAIPAPKVKVPSSVGSGTAEHTAAKEMLEAYTSNHSAYMMYPEGWELEVFDVDFDADKVRKIIDSENQEIVNSILAPFLLLGQGDNSGSHALSGDLSNFFAQTLQFMADHISEVLHRRVTRSLTKMNWGDTPCMVELVCEDLKDQAGKVLAEIVKSLVDSGVLRADDALEKDLRKRFGLPEIDIETIREKAPTPTPGLFSEKEERHKRRPFQLAESSVKAIFYSGSPDQIIKKSSDDLAQVFKNYLGIIGQEYITKLIKQKNDLTDSAQLSAATRITASGNDYLEMIKFLCTKAAMDAQAHVQKTLDKSIKLASSKQVSTLEKRQERIDELGLKLTDLAREYSTGPYNQTVASELSATRKTLTRLIREQRKDLEDAMQMSTTQRRNIASRASFVYQTQMSDLEKGIGLQYQSSAPSTVDDGLLRKDLTEKLSSIQSGAIVNTGPSILANQTVNEAIVEAPDNLDLGDSVESYTFVAVDDDRTTDICQELDGHTFSSDDPDLARYSPPLHYNCRSYLAINPRGARGNPSIDNKVSLSKAAEKSINLSED